MHDEPLWSPDRQSLPALPISAFAAEASRRAGKPFDDYDSLHAWSVEDPGAFWDLVWDFCGVIGEKGERLIAEAATMRETRFFPDARLNFAENLLRRMGPGDAIVFRGEDKVERRLSWDELSALVSRLQQAMRAEGVGVGDRVAAMLPNMPEAIAVMLADRVARRDLLLLLAGFRRTRRARPFWADRAKTVLRRRRLLVQRQAGRRRREGEGRSPRR